MDLIYWLMIIFGVFIIISIIILLRRDKRKHKELVKNIKNHLEKQGHEVKIFEK